MLIFGFLPIISFFIIYLAVVRISSKADCLHRETFLLSSLIWGAGIALSTEILTLFEGIGFVSVLSFWIFVALMAFFLYFKFHGSFSMIRSLRLPQLSRFEWLLLSVIGFIGLMVGVVAWMAAPNSWDAVNYHMSRVAFWQQNHSVQHYPTPEFRQLFFQPWAEYAFLHFQILSGSDRFANLVSWFSFCGSMVGASLIASYLGLSRRTQILTALWVATIPTLIIEASSVKLDPVAGYWLVCLVCLLLSMSRKPSLVKVVFFALSLGLGLLTKGTLYLLSAPFVVWFVVVLLKKYPKRKTLQYLTLLGLIVLLINSGFYYRNSILVGEPLGPFEMRQWGLTSDMTIPLLLSNVLKTIGYQLGNPIHAWNEFVVHGMHRVHDFWGINIIDPRSTYNKTAFHVSVSVHEDGVTNFLQVSLWLIAFSVLGVVGLKSGNKQLVLFLLCLIGSFVFVCGSIKWNNQTSRYYIPLFILSSVVLGYFCEKYLKEKTAVLMVLVLCLTATAMPYVFRNNLRRVISAKKQTVFNTARLDQYFRNDSSLLNPYIQAVEEVKKRNCRQVGLFMGFNFWDYPFWVILKEKLSGSFRLEHMQINSYAPKDYPLGPFEPCAIIKVGGYRERLDLEGYPVFQRVRDFTKTSVYVPDKGL